MEYTFISYASINDKAVELWRLMDGDTKESNEQYTFMGLAHGDLFGMSADEDLEIWIRNPAA